MQGADESTCKPGPVPRPVSPRFVAAAIHLELPLPTASSGLPGSSGGPPSNAPCLTLLQVGFAEPPGSPRALVVSYTTVSPLPAAEAAGGLFSVALSRESPRVGVTDHPALRSPDFPRRVTPEHHPTRPPGRLVRRTDQGTARCPLLSPGLTRGSAACAAPPCRLSIGASCCSLCRRSAH